jgi:hypothetical protein
VRPHLAIVCFSVLLTLNLTAAPNRSTDDIPLRNWPVAFDTYVKAAPSASGRFQAMTNDVASGPATFVAVTPCRLVDTRNANGPYGGPIFAAGETRSYSIPAASVAANCSVPIGAAYSLNFTIVNYSGRGNLKAYPTGTTPPTVSTLNYGAGLPIANAAIVPADGNGSIDVAIAMTATPGPTNVVIDINGYFANGVGAPQFFTTTPNGPLVIPPGVTRLLIEAWGGGGSGSGFKGGITNFGGDGGGGGGYARALVPVTAGDSLDIVIGVGGSGVSSGAGMSGTDTIIYRGLNALLDAGGGVGAATNTPGAGGIVTAPPGTTLLQHSSGQAGSGGSVAHYGGPGGFSGFGGTPGMGGAGGDYSFNNSGGGQAGLMIITFLP